MKLSETKTTSSPKEKEQLDRYARRLDLPAETQQNLILTAQNFIVENGLGIGMDREELL